MKREIIDAFFNFLNSQTFAAIIGALIGILPAHLITARHERRKKQMEDRLTYLGWLHGLSAETEHIKKCIQEITSIFKSIPRDNICTKRMNHDFLEKARLVIFGYDKDVCFLETLTNAYRDVLHTNDMINRHERFVLGKQFHLSEGIIGNVICSLQGVDNSITALKSQIDEKLKKSGT